MWTGREFLYDFRTRITRLRFVNFLTNFCPTRRSTLLFVKIGLMQTLTVINRGGDDQWRSLRQQGILDQTRCEARLQRFSGSR